MTDLKSLQESMEVALERNYFSKHESEFKMRILIAIAERLERIADALEKGLEQIEEAK